MCQIGGLPADVGGSHLHIQIHGGNLAIARDLGRALDGTLEESSGSLVIANVSRNLNTVAERADAILGTAGLVRDSFELRKGSSEIADEAEVRNVVQISSKRVGSEGADRSRTARFEGIDTSKRSNARRRSR